MKKNDISLVVVDAIGQSIDENGDVAIKNITDLVTAKLAGKLYEFSNKPHFSAYRSPPKKDSGQYKLEDLSKDIIIVGGSLGNEHYSAFVSVLGQAKEKGIVPVVHIPLNCTYSFTQEYDSGEAWTDGCLGNSEMKILTNYTKDLAKNVPGAYIIEKNGKFVSKSPVFALKLWDDWKQMADYLGKK